MIIKYSDKFESIFYGLLYTNLTSHVLVAKNLSNDQQSLFDNDEFIDIDKVNFSEILINHNNKFGEIRWFDSKNKDL